MSKCIDLDDVLFHGFDYANGKDRSATSLIKLQSVLESGYLYSRARQLEKLSDKQELYEFFAEYNSPVNDWNWNGKDYISLCAKKSKIMPKYDSMSYKHYIKGDDGIGLIFPKSICDISDTSRWKLMDSEYQVKDEISLSQAVGVCCGLASGKSVLEKLETLKKLGYSRENVMQDIKNMFYEKQVENYNRIKEMLVNSGYNLPIISTIDGYEVENLLDIINNFNFVNEDIISM